MGGSPPPEAEYWHDDQYATSLCGVVFLAKVMNTESIKKEVYDYMSEGKNFEVKIRPEKTAVVDQMKEKLSGAKGAVLVPTTNSV